MQGQNTNLELGFVQIVEKPNAAQAARSQVYVQSQQYALLHASKGLSRGYISDNPTEIMSSSDTCLCNL